jgi:sulfhydrogenase subunit beta (sulfur reductase)
MMSAGVVIGPDGLEKLVKALLGRGYRAVGPVVRDGAITMGEVEGTADLPRGWRDDQGPGTYSLSQSGSRNLFDWAVGPQSMKAEVFPPRSTIWTAKPPDYVVQEAPDDDAPLAVVGARPCDLAALEVLGRALVNGSAADPTFQKRRSGAFLVVAECTRPAATCFCVSMGTGPGASHGFDIRLTELPGAGTENPRYLALAGTRQGRDMLEGVPGHPARPAEEAERVNLLARAASHMGRSIDNAGLPELLARNLSNPRWDDVAERCLACGNCTAVCPTCFCANFEDTTDLQGTVRRQRTWASCSDLAHSYVHGGPVRSSIKSRYRQWATHKFSWWWDQFGTSGCTGCGRCITWCPAGIDITEEIAALRAGDGAATTTKGGGEK